MDVGTPEVAARRIGRPPQAPWLFVVPAALLGLAVVLGPALLGAGYAFFEWDGLTAPEWVGLANFAEFLDEPEGMGVLANTVVLALLYVACVNAGGLCLALGLSHTLRTRSVLRAVFLLPAVVSPLVVGYIWKYVLDARGPLNQALDAAGLGWAAQPWLGRPSTALVAIVGVMAWQFAGYHMLIYLAGLQGIQAELMEAAAVDGAGPLRRFRSVTLPLLRPAITIGVALSTINAFMVFDQVMALTGGGPAGGTDTLGTYVYKQAFVNGRYGYSAAIALLLVALVCLVALVQFRAARRSRS